VLFTYRKPYFLDEIFQSIKKYSPPRLYVASNMHACNEEIATVKSIREIIESWRLPCEIVCLFRDNHLLINDSIHSGLDYVLGIEDSAIVLEDDTIPSQSFFSFCNKMLQRYQDSDDIGSVVGCNLGCEDDDNAYIVPFAFVYWGWATWAKKWKMLRNTSLPWGAKNNNVADKLQDSTSIIIPFLERIDERCTWDVRWGWQQAIHDMEVIVSGRNLIRNKGFIEEGSYIRFKDSIFSDMPTKDFESKYLDVKKCNHLSYSYEKASAELLSEILSFRNELDLYTERK